MLNKKEIYLLLIALCFLAYANSLGNVFVSDDIPGILENPAISHPLHFWLEPASLLNSFNYLIAGYNPFIYHLTNIILHSLNTILVFFFLLLFFKKEAAFLGACLFAVHPVHAEAVTWVSGRPYIITSLFILIVYLLYYYSTPINPKPTPSSSLRAPKGRSNLFLRLLRRLQLLAMTIVRSLAMTTKGRLALYIISLLIFSYYLFFNFPFYFIFPLFLILSDITLNRWRKTWKLWFPFLAIVILRLLFGRSLILQRISFVLQEAGTGVARVNPIFNFAYSFFSHMGLLLWPVKLTLYHEPAVISFSHLAAGLFFLSLLLISSPFIFKKAKELFFGVGIFVLFLAPTYSPVMVSWLVAERYLYFPSIMLSIFLAFFYERIIGDGVIEGVSTFNLFNGKKKSRNVLIIFILIIAGLGVRTVARNEDWKTPERFWRQTALVSMNSPRAHNNMGDVYSREGNTDGAIREFKKAIELKADYADAYHNLATIYHRKGDLKEAIRLYQQAVSFKPKLFQSRYNLGLIYLNADEFDLARLELEKALELRPDDANARSALGLAAKNLKK